MNHYPQFIKFVVAGCLGFVVDAGILYLALHNGFDYYIGRAISFTCAVLTTWLINRKFAFANLTDKPVVDEVVRYFIAMSFGGIVNYIVYLIVIIESREMAFLPLIAVAAGSIAGMVINFMFAKLWVFKNQNK